ncbi:MAG TPA: IS1 family transposase [Chloroflexi bacterium]|nr:IS1 family transposase [Chloroflexota bacterium]
MVKCPHCQSTERQVKVGYTSAGSQRYLCRKCERKYTPEPKRRGYDEATRRKAVEMYVDGMNFRRIGRMLGVAHRTVINWVNAYAASLPDEPPVPGEAQEVHELDELYTFVGSKKTKSTSSHR